MTHPPECVCAVGQISEEKNLLANIYNICTHLLHIFYKSTSLLTSPSVCAGGQISVTFSLFPFENYPFTKTLFSLVTSHGGRPGGQISVTFSHTFTGCATSHHLWDRAASQNVTNNFFKTFLSSHLFGHFVSVIHAKGASHPLMSYVKQHLAYVTHNVGHTFVKLNLDIWSRI